MDVARKPLIFEPGIMLQNENEEGETLTNCDIPDVQK